MYLTSAAPTNPARAKPAPAASGDIEAGGGAGGGGAFVLAATCGGSARVKNL